MRLSDFDFEVPKELIAQSPAEPRDSSRLLVLDRPSGRITHRVFREIVDELKVHDLLVINNTKVFPARVEARKPTGARLEVLFLRERGEGIWETLIFPGKRVDMGTEILFDHGSLTCRVTSRSEDGVFTVMSNGSPITISNLEKLGRIPLPPYVRASRESSPELETRYQTVYAKHNGASAAPTAGLHFMPELLNQLRGKGVDIAEVTLHTGYATFRPVRVENAEDHPIHTEWCDVSTDVISKIRRAKEKGGRVIAVGTTVVRALETAARNGLSPFQGETSLYILPGYQFQVVDALITNFHWPRTTLILMIAAFAGKEKMLSAYSEAIQKHYRFFSFGDAMLIV